jgi:hypothetical protein
VLVNNSGKSESGKTMDRAATERVRAGETDGIIVALTDRFGRAPIEEGASALPGEAGTRRQHRRSPGVDGPDDLGVVNALQVDRRDAEICVSELSLNDVERNAFASHLDGVCVAKLVWAKAATDAGVGGQVSESVAGGGS